MYFGLSNPPPPFPPPPTLKTKPARHNHKVSVIDVCLSFGVGN